jgi:tetraacyldisaccharide-1-P 4'-kinase
MQAVGWRDVRGERVTGLPGRKCLAFCALGNPQSFWSTLDTLGLQITSRQTFRDHHRYQAAEIRRLIREAERKSVDCLVTTEKDWINLPDQAKDLFGSLELFWLEIECELENGAEFFSILDRRLAEAAKHTRRLERANLRANGLHNSSPA